MPDAGEPTIRLGLPKGRMQEGVFRLLRDAGLEPKIGAREYRPTVALPGFEAKIQKPQNIIEMLASGTRDVGFAGKDWVMELGVDVVELLDLKLDPVTLVAACPPGLLEGGELPKRRLVVASEYTRLTTAWIVDQGLDAEFVRSFGATEVFPPEDADLIVDITQTGSTLRANGLMIYREIDHSSTRLFASRHAMDDQDKRRSVEELVVLLRSVLEARRRLMVEMNVPSDKLDELVAILPCMREPTVSTLHHGAGFAVKAAVPKSDLPLLIPRIKAVGGTDIVVTPMAQIVP